MCSSDLHDVALAHPPRGDDIARRARQRRNADKSRPTLCAAKVLDRGEQRFRATRIVEIRPSKPRREWTGRTVKLKLRLADFTTFTRQKTVPERVQSSEDVARVAGLLLAVELQPGRLFRLVGVGVSGFEESVPAEDVLQPRLAGFE